MITVNIMSYKYGHVAAHAVESVLSQTKKADVVRLYDDGVGDCKHIKTLYPEVEVIEREKNLGIVDNFQDALMRTETDKVMFLGADNWLRPDTLENLDAVVGDIISYDIYLFGTEAEEFSKLVPCYPEDGYRVWACKGMHGSSLYNTNLAKKYGYKRNPDSVKSEEDKMLFDAMVEGGAVRAHVSVPLLYYRRHKHNFQ